MSNILLIVLFTLVALDRGDPAAWSYGDGDDGLSHWGDSNPACLLQAQSPIDIVEADTEENDEKTALTFTSGVENTNKPTITNNGHSVNFADFPTDSSITLEGGTYNLAGIHLHWGSTDEKGSEHLLNGKAFSAELHMVHYNSSYASLSEAAPQDDGLAVIGIFLEASDAVPVSNQFFICLEASLDLVQTKETKNIDCLGSAFDPYSILPKDDTHYAYKGSLTTPPCYQSVKWTVYKEPVKISTALVAKLRTLKNKEEKIVDNFRPPQGLNGRKVYESC